MKDDGRFIFSIIHPCFDYIAKNGEIERTARYFGVRDERVPWRMKRLLRPFETTSFHRTLTDYSTALYKHGLVIRRLLEPKPTRKGSTNFPLLKQVLLRPHSIIFETVKNMTKDYLTLLETCLTFHTVSTGRRAGAFRQSTDADRKLRRARSRFHLGLLCKPIDCRLLSFVGSFYAHFDRPLPKLCPDHQP